MNSSQAKMIINSQAYVPEHLLSYVYSVSNVESELINDYVFHKNGRQLIFIGYNLQDPNNTANLDESLNQKLQQNNFDEITVLAPIRPSIAPEHALCSSQDAYWFVDLPLTKIKDKVKNMLVRAENEIYIDHSSGKNSWTSEHHEIMLSYIRRKSMEIGLCTIVQKLENYLINTEEALLISAYSKTNKELLGFTLADFSSFTTAFYMFAFRQEERRNLPCGIADALLFDLFKEAEARAYTKCNLGLGINDGIRFFKKKWNAQPSLPFIQTKWKVEDKKSWFSLFIN